MPSVMWFRRDLRLADNPALLEALAEGEVLPLWVLDPALWGPAGHGRRAYLAASLRCLAASLRDLGGRLVVRHGDPVEVVPSTAAEVGARQVHAAADFAPYGARRDAAVAEALATTGVELVRTGSPYAVSPGRLHTATGEPFRVYSPFQRRWHEHGWRAPAPRPADPRWLDLPGDGLPEAAPPDGMSLPDPGEEAALRRWRDFLDGPVEHYADDRNRPGVDGTSRMSVHLRWGEVHPRTLLADLAGLDGAGPAAYRRELAWRDFYADVLHHRPQSARDYLRPDLARLQYDDPGAALAAWQEGRTGFPIVDAGMRQLRGRGWMHNRVRMIVASFLVKDLHVEWQHGARHFMRWLADGDLASNAHGWQWVAGSGTDPAPYFRVFNPTTQGRKFDPDGSYVRQWLPELRELPEGADVHDPAPEHRLRVGYPDPVVDHAEERREALARWEAARRTEDRAD